MPHERTRDEIGHQGEIIFTEEIDTYVWLPLYSKVNGSLPVDETPDIVGRGANRHAVARTFIDVTGGEEIRLKLSGKLDDLVFFHGDKEIPLSESEIEMEIIINNQRKS